jgi:hypothetical protein
MPPRGFLVAFAMSAALAGRAARADETPEPSAERLKSAAEEYDLGRRTYLAGKYEEAAIHFETAFHDAPRPEPLRAAIRARRAAHQDARAASLASLAAVRYATDPPTLDMANEALSELSPRLLGISLACTPDCEVAVDGRVVSLLDAKQHVFYVTPGSHAVVASWSGDRSKRVTVEGNANVVRDVTLLAPPVPSPSSTSAGAAPVTSPPPPPSESTKASSGGKPFAPAVFAVGVSLTALGIGATIVSGVLAENDPGKAAVLRDCVGQGTGCPTYQDGKSAELRTNVILAATGGVAVVTAVIGVFLTQWTRTSASAGARVEPFAAIDSRSTSLGLRGAF